MSRSTRKPEGSGRTGAKRCPGGKAMKRRCAANTRAGLSSAGVCGPRGSKRLDKASYKLNTAIWARALAPRAPGCPLHAGRKVWMGRGSSRCLKVGHGGGDTGLGRHAGPKGAGWLEAMPLPDSLVVGWSVGGLAEAAHYRRRAVQLLLLPRQRTAAHRAGTPGVETAPPPPVPQIQTCPQTPPVFSPPTAAATPTGKKGTRRIRATQTIQAPHL